MSSPGRSGNIVRKLIFCIENSFSVAILGIMGHISHWPIALFTFQSKFCASRISYHADHLRQNEATQFSGTHLRGHSDGSQIKRMRGMQTKSPSMLGLCCDQTPVMLASWPAAIIKIILGACSNQISKPCRINNRFYNYNITCRSMKNSKLN